MRPVNSGKLGSASGSLFVLPTPVQFASGKKLARIRIKAVVPVDCTDSSGYQFANADGVALFAAVFSAVTIAFGDVVLDTVDDSMPFARMREMLIAASERDMIFNGGQLNALSTTSSNKFKALYNATTNVTIEYVRTFVYERSGSNLHDWCPGTSQTKQLKLQVTQGTLGSIDGGDVTIDSAGSTLTVFFDDLPSSTDNWSKCFRLYRNTTGGLVQEGPAGGGGLLMLWEWTAAGASTSLTIFNVQRAGDTNLHEDINASDVVRAQQNILPLGSYDLNTLVTVLYSPDDFVKRGEIPTASDWIFNQPNGDLTPAQTAWLYVPTVTQSYVDGTIGQNAIGGQGKPTSLKATNAYAVTGAKVAPNTAAIAPVALVPQSSPAYQLQPGRLFQVGSEPTTHIPAPVTSAAQAAVSANGPNANAALSKASTAIASAIPGGTSPQRGMLHPVQQQVASHLASAGAATAAGKATAAAKGKAAVQGFATAIR